jgi:beta-RFAP synthase
MKLADLRLGTAAVATVTAPGRLHLGFIDPAGTRGRRFGSLGLAIDGPATRVTLRPAPRDAYLCAIGTEAEAARVREVIARLKRSFRRDGALEVQVHETLPAHAGFGSGTQLALALGHAFAAVHGIDVGSVELARVLGRGARSGVGIAAFDQGGLLLDGGPGGAAPAPILARVDFPPAWRVLLVLDPAAHGLAGADEARALAALPPLAQSAAARLAHAVLMQILPAAHEGDFAPFARGVTEVQRVLGAHFAPAQGGRAYTSAAVEALLEWIAQRYGAAIGQSSWGPTGFAVFDSAPAALRAVEAARAAGVVAPHLCLRVVGGRNRGATLETAE